MRTPKLFEERSLDTIQFFRKQPHPKQRLIYLFLFAETSAVRFWIGLCSIGWAFVMANHVLHDHASLDLMLNLAPWYLWVLLFSTNGFSLIYGVITKKYSTLQLILEPLLGLTLWSCAALSHAITQASIGPITLGAMVFFWLLVRYPTHQEKQTKKAVYD